jgi:hypothetical protein
MKKIIEIIVRVDAWIMKTGYSFYPELTRHQKNK